MVLSKIIIAAVMLATVLTKPHKTTDAILVNLGVTYYTPKQVSAETDSHGLLTVHQCDISTGGLANAVLAIIMTDNPNLDISSSFALVEVSSVNNVFNSSTVIGVNYVYNENGNIQQLFNNITFKYPGNDNQIYIRYRAIGSASPLTFQLSYSNTAPIQIGQYEYDVFGTIQESGNFNNPFLQFVALSTEGEVTTNEYDYYYFNFCEYQEQTNTYTVNANIVNVPGSPLSAFDIFVCAKSQVPDYTDCNANSLRASSNQCSCSVASTSITNTENILESGVYVSVYGKGAPANSTNYYILSVSTSQ